uniref:Uncharacterized protein n=1 Tax=Avena sativa TaxID=4498 RepID=A0ACD5Y5Y4_AVESA
MATPASWPPPSPPPFSEADADATSDTDESSDSESGVSVWDSQDLRSHAERNEAELLSAMSVDASLLPSLNHLLLEVYAALRPKPVDYEQRNALVHVFHKMATKIFGNDNGFPVVQAFGSFTMDLFTPKSDLDLSVNFTAETEDLCDRKKKIKVIRKFSKVLYSLQRDGIYCGVLPLVSARVPIVNVIDRETGIECDITVENKDGMTRSMVFKFVSSLDERFRILSYLVKIWAKIHDVNSSREQTMSSISIISLVAFHLQHRPAILQYCLRSLPY